MMSLLDDPSSTPPWHAQSIATPEQTRVRFRTNSTYARDLAMAGELEGIITGRYELDGRDFLNVLGDHWFATCVPADEVEPCSSRTP